MTKLGQHFLISSAIAHRMVEAAEVGLRDVVLEIGPGRGILTAEILKRASRVIAVEKDPRLIKFLKERLSFEEKSGRLILIQADIRDFLKPPTNVKHSMFDKVVANIPYYLTGRLLRHFLPKMYQVRLNTFVFMLQREVAQRIIAQHSEPAKGKLNLLAISVQVFAEPKIAFYVKKTNFKPQPKVDSAVIVLKRREKDFFKEHKISQKKFFELVRTGFKHPRKLLKSNLKMSNIECLTRCGIGANDRAEDLSLEKWACLTKNSNSKNLSR